MEGEVTEGLLETTKQQVEKERWDLWAVELKKYDIKTLTEFELAKLDYIREGFLWGRMGAEGYFNNFIYNLPGSRLRVKLEELGVELNIRHQDDHQLHSELFRGQTRKQFYGTIDKAIQTTGLNLEEITQLCEEAERTSDASKLHKYIFPVFIRLRAMGYSRYDLIA